MKVWLDDIREAPEGWVRTRTPEQTIAFLRTGEVTALSLDHDLGFDSPFQTGYDVLTWLESKVHEGPFPLPKVMKVHSANTAAKERMEIAIEEIRRFVEERGPGAGEKRRER